MKTNTIYDLIQNTSIDSSPDTISNILEILIVLNEKIQELEEKIKLLENPHFYD